MPRNASGTYSLPSGNPVSSGTLIDATWANNTLNDIANEMTDSLSRSGEGGMLAPFRLNDGVQATPGLAFTNEPSTGMYRAGTNEAWLVAGGTQVLQFTTNGAAARFAAGAVGTPSLTFSGDLNTGLWSPAADTLAASTGGSERLRVNLSGNVGIGTTNPVAPLVVSNAGTSGIEFNPSGGPGSGAYFNCYNRGTSAFIPWTNYASVHTWFVGTAGSTRAMDLDASGNLGIGTASPAHRLDVVGTGSQDIRIRTETSGNPRLILEAAGGNSGAVLWNRTGNVLEIDAGGSIAANFDGNRNVTVGAGTLATTATNGFLYVPTCAGVPTGTPTAKTGYAPIVVDTTNNRWYFYSGGAWRNAGP